MASARGAPAGGFGPIRSGWSDAAAAAGLVAVLLIWLTALNRPLLCPCGAVRFWAPDHDSQHLSDWYSLLHISFGFGLALLVNHVQPAWPLPRKGLVVLASSALWEGIENLPVVIARFNTPGAPGSYGGDTIVNALGDTIFVLGGFLLATRVRPGIVVVAALLIEAAVWFAIRDGLLVGTLRLMA
ncbi:MAG TPA: DUF2585 family protein [Allosphingosinicella sp.]|jgi:hypothetical protein